MKNKKNKKRRLLIMKNKNNKTRLAGLFVLIMVLLVLLVSCDSSTDPKKAVNGLNENISFYDAFSLYCKGMVDEISEEDDAKVDYEITIQNGWSASSKLDDGVLEGREKAITYCLDITSKSDYETKKYKVKFFMRFDESRNVVIPSGVYIYNNGNIEEGSALTAGEMVIDIYEHYKDT